MMPRCSTRGISSAWPSRPLASNARAPTSYVPSERPEIGSVKRKRPGATSVAVPLSLPSSDQTTRVAVDVVSASKVSCVTAASEMTGRSGSETVGVMSCSERTTGASARFEVLMTVVTDTRRCRPSSG
jgi:hypothetical protein